MCRLIYAFPVYTCHKVWFYMMPVSFIIFVEVAPFQLDVELLGFKTRVRDLTALMKRNEKQFYDLNCELQDLKAHVTGDTEKLTTSSHDADELQVYSRDNCTQNGHLGR